MRREILTRKPSRILESKHYRKQWKVVQTCQSDLQDSFQANNSNPRACKCQVEDEHSRQQEELQSEQDRSE
jgi:hypothetical protein